MRIAPPTLLPNLDDVFPTLFKYEFKRSLFVLLFRSGGVLVSPKIPPTKKAPTYDGPIVAESFSVNIVIPFLSSFSNDCFLPDL